MRFAFRHLFKNFSNVDAFFTHRPYLIRRVGQRPFRSISFIEQSQRTAVQKSEQDSNRG